jgi:hypothetical protein
MTQSEPQVGGEIALFEAPDGQIRLDVRLERDTVWLTQAQMVELFGRDQSVISRHVQNVFKEGELERESNMQKMHIANSDKPVEIYNLEVIISIGYRVNSKRGTQFRIWATRTLRDHLVQGYTLNERRLREKGLTEMEQAMRLMAFWAPSNRRLTVKRSIRASNRGLRTCCILCTGCTVCGGRKDAQEPPSSRTIPLPKATNASVVFCFCYTSNATVC